MVRWARRWWQQSDQFDWFSAYLEDRNLETQWRAATFGCAVLLATLPILMLGSPAGPNHSATVWLSIIAAVSGAVSASMWLRRWPTRRQSLLLCVMGSASIAAICLAQSNPYVGLEGCHIFAIVGGYIAYFHTTKLLASNLAMAVACSAILAGRLAAASGDLSLVTASLITIAALNIGVPFGIHSLVHTLRTDLRSSDRDSLTGLLNRRSFYHSAYELVMRHHGSPDRYLVVAMVDLDNFKQLNDAQGHAAGDQALIDVSTSLRNHCGATAAIGRAGGEEFVIADIDSASNPAAMAERLRQAIAGLPIQITASIGTASAPLDTDVDRRLIEGLVGAADAAMYDAKRAGGNGIRHRDGVPSPG
jgi:diguanylate cyclase (GGDEF)-like protein